MSESRTLGQPTGRRQRGRESLSRPFAMATCSKRVWLSASRLVYKSPAREPLSFPAELVVRRCVQIELRAQTLPGAPVYRSIRHREARPISAESSPSAALTVSIRSMNTTRVERLAPSPPETRFPSGPRCRALRRAPEDTEYPILCPGPLFAGGRRAGGDGAAASRR
jgi:hypothetical protein